MRPCAARSKVSTPPLVKLLLRCEPEHVDAQRAAGARADHQCSRTRDRRGGPDDHMPTALEQARDDGNQQFRAIEGSSCGD